MKKLSVLLYCDTKRTKAVRRCMKSLLMDSGLPGEEIQIILLDPGFLEEQEDSDEDPEELDIDGVAEELDVSGNPKLFEIQDDGTDWEIENLTERCPENITLLQTPGMEAAQAYNAGMKIAEGEYFSFMLMSSWYQKNALSKLLYPQREEYSDENLLSLTPVFRRKREAREYIMAPKSSGIKEAMVAPESVQLVLQAYLIRREFMEGMQFRESLHEESFPAMVLELLVKNNGRIFFAKNYRYFYTIPLEDDKEFCALAEKKWWYIDSVRNFLLDFMERMKEKYHGQIPLYIQNTVFYLMCAKYSCNLSGEDKLMMNHEEAEAFFGLCFELLTMIDLSLLYQRNKYPKIAMPRALRSVFIEGKAQKQGYEAVVSRNGNAVTYGYRVPGKNREIDKTVVGKIDQEVLNIRVINYRDGKLEIDGFFQGGAYLPEGSYTLFGEIEGKKAQRVEVARSTVYGLLKCFGISYSRKYQVHIEVPVKDLAGKRMAFYVQYEGAQRRLKMTFTSVNSRLLTSTKRAYWRFDDNKYILSRWGNYLLVTKSSPLTVLKKELALDAALLSQKNHREAFTCVAFRMLYWLLRPWFKRKKIWVTFDKLFKAGDNGEYMFQYCQKQKDGIDCYYVINKDAEDCRRLEKMYPHRVLYANSWKARMIVLNAEVILATHAGTSVYLGFPASIEKYFKDLYQSDNICIQHGLSIQKIANFQNRIYANTKLYCLASPFELENVSHPIYGYEPEMLKLTGLARYDGLRDNEQKQILITPTWRKNVVHTKGVGLTNSHSSHFKETAYYRIYNSLINDEELISCAKETGYRIIFLLHPAMSAQMEDYDRNEYVELIQATGNMSYEKILTESSLMVTDYSGVQFDFAYQRKPVVYYHPDELPPHYMEGGLIYETMGFGPICHNHEQIIGELCKYMRSGCIMEKSYKERADQFFAFNDFNNAERIYQEVRKFESEK